MKVNSLVCKGVDWLKPKLSRYTASCTLLTVISPWDPFHCLIRAFTRLQADSAWLVVTPVWGLVNSREWFTRPNSNSLLKESYALHSSAQIIEPGFTNSLTRPHNVGLFRLATSLTIARWVSGQYTPKTHMFLAGRPLSYFLFAIRESSLWTTIFLPPTFSFST